MSAELPLSGYHVSQINFDSVVTAADRICLPITITDVTLREGQQCAGVAFSLAEQVEIASALADVGVPIVQVGYAGADDEAIRQVHAARPDVAINALLVGWKPDAETAMDSALEAGADICSLLFRSADRHLANLGFTREQAIDRVTALIGRASRLGYREVVLGPSFSTLADASFLMELYRAALDTGATVISLADSNGTARPALVRHLVTQMRELAGNRHVRVHMHDDFGLAVANTLAGIEAGADWVEVTVSGLGERAGNCPLEELVVALEGLYGVRTGVSVAQLATLCRLVERLSGVSIPATKAVTGANCFANKLEIHVKAAAADASLMEPYDPELVGGRRTIVLGRGTGPTGLSFKLQELGLQLDEEKLGRASEAVNALAVSRKGAISDEEFADIVSALAGKS